ncbi:MAG: PDZ domain-containing protein [Bacteroidia bacterium]|nr:PDZ domain-containing protein [Bacteroidia bacterium]
MKRINSFFAAMLILMLAASFIHVQADAQSIAGKEKKTGAWLGVRLKVEKIEIESDGKTEIRENANNGAVVEGVVKDSPAEKAGLKKGDVITAFGSKDITTAEALMDAVREATPGSSIALTTLRDGKKSTVNVELAESPSRDEEKRVVRRSIRAPRAPRSPLPPSAPMLWHGKSASYGLSLSTLNKQLGEYFGAPDGKGVLVEKVDENSDAAKAGFKAGDVILRAGKKTVVTVSDFRSVLGAYDAGEKIPVNIIRKGAKQTIELTAKEPEKDLSFHGAPGLGGVFRFRSDGADDQYEDALKRYEDVLKDIDIDIDMDEMKEGMRKMRIIIDGKELELDNVNESLRGIMEDVKSHMEELREGESESVEKKVKIRATQI